MRVFGGIDGRATRREFWWYVLRVQLPLQCLALCLLLPIALIHETHVIKLNDLTAFELAGCVTAMVLIVTAVLTSIGISVRRLHDLNLSGHWLILLVILNGIPYLRGPVFVLGVMLLGCVKGRRCENRYGVCRR